MIKLQQYTPDVYYNESRDFQFIGRLFDLVLNYTKTNVELVYSLPLSSNSDDQFIELLALTLGFKPRHKYTTKHLRAICSVLSEILRNKGTAKAIMIACNAIAHAEGITNTASYQFGSTGGFTDLKIYIPANISETTLLTDLLSYIIPAGVSVNIIKVFQFNRQATTTIGSQSEAKLITPWDPTGTRREDIQIVDGHYNYQYNASELSQVPTFENKEADADLGDTIGAIANAQVFKPGEDGE